MLLKWHGAISVIGSMLELKTAKLLGFIFLNELCFDKSCELIGYHAV